MELQLNRKTEQLSSDSRVWIYQADRELNSEEVERIHQAGKRFVMEWASHGKDLEAAFEVLKQRFIIIITDEEKAMASGCSIDKSVHLIQNIEQEFDVNLFDRMLICYDKEGRIEQCNLAAVPDLVASGELTEGTCFYDNTITKKAQLKSDWLVRMGDSWMKRYFM